VRIVSAVGPGASLPLPGRETGARRPGAVEEERVEL